MPSARPSGSVSEPTCSQPCRRQPTRHHDLSRGSSFAPIGGFRVGGSDRIAPALSIANDPPIARGGGSAGLEPGEGVEGFRERSWGVERAPQG